MGILSQTNGPLIDFALGGKSIGDELNLPEGRHELQFTAWLRSIVPVDHLEIVCNGQVVKSLPLSGSRHSADARGTLPIEKSGWCLLRAWSEKAQHPVLDSYPYATSSPIYVTVGGAPVRSPVDAAYFLAWIDRLKKATEAHQDWNTAAEKAEVLKLLAEAAKRFKMEN